MEIKSCHDIVTNVRNLLDFFWGVVIAQFVAGSSLGTNGVLVNIHKGFASGAVTVGIATVDTSVGQVLLSTGGPVASQAHEEVVTIVRVQLSELVTGVELLEWEESRKVQQQQKVKYVENHETEATSILFRTSADTSALCSKKV
jgi:hypothetical protein